MLKAVGRALRKALVRTRRRIRASDGLMYLLLRLRNLLLYILVLGFLVFEEIWEVLRDLLAFRHYYPRLMAAVNRFAARQNRYLVLFIYLSLFVPMELLGLASAALVAEGYWKSALLMYASKGLVAIPAIDIFVANRNKLLSFGFIAWSYGLLLRFKRSEIYQSVVDFMGKARQRVREWFRR
ncbi:hypothetical protein [Thiolapillus sp.]